MNFQVLDIGYRIFNKTSEKFQSINGQRKLDTRPVISDYSYQLHCRTKLLNHADLEEFKIESFKSSKNRKGLYLSPDLLSKFKDCSEEGEVNLAGIDFLIIGRYSKVRDYCIERLNIGSLNQYFRDVWVEQLSVEFENVKALPVGIEDPTYLGGRHYKKLLEYSTCSEVPSKKYRFLIAWNDKTNIEVRASTRKFFRGIDGSIVIDKRIAIQTLHYLMRRSIYVVCPSGAAGWDTHRVWEALYCGATPILCGKDIPRSVRDWPVLVLNDWEELADLQSFHFEEQIKQNSQHRKNFTEFQKELWRTLQ